MKASEQLKHDLIAEMRNTAAGRELDVSLAQVELDFAAELPTEYEGCRSVYTAKVVKVASGQLVVVADCTNDETTCDESELLTRAWKRSRLSPRQSTLLRRVPSGTILRPQPAVPAQRQPIPIPKFLARRYSARVAHCHD